jgi:hypothetical protein
MRHKLWKSYLSFLQFLVHTRFSDPCKSSIISGNRLGVLELLFDVSSLRRTQDIVRTSNTSDGGQHFFSLEVVPMQLMLTVQKSRSNNEIENVIIFFTKLFCFRI